MTMQVLPAISRSSASRTLASRSEEHTSELQSQSNLVCRLLLEKKKNKPQHAFGQADRVHIHGPHAQVPALQACPLQEHHHLPSLDHHLAKSIMPVLAAIALQSH